MARGPVFVVCGQRCYLGLFLTENATWNFVWVRGSVSVLLVVVSGSVVGEVVFLRPFVIQYLCKQEPRGYSPSKK